MVRVDAVPPVIVNLVITKAPLLSGSVRDCASRSDSTTTNNTTTTTAPAPTRSNDSNKCTRGGVASVQACVRLHTSREQNVLDNVDNNNTNRLNMSSTSSNSSSNNNSTVHHEPVLVIPMGEFKGPLIELSRFFYGVNIMIFSGELNWRTWTVPAYTLWPKRLEEAMLYDAQDPLFPALVSNVATLPTDRWHPYVKSIHYDDETHLAVIYITKEYLDNTYSQIETAVMLLDYVSKYNGSNGCGNGDQTTMTTESSISKMTSHAAFQVIPFSEWWREFGSLQAQAQQHDGFSSVWGDTNTTTTHQELDPDNCYLPIIIFDDKSKTQYEMFIDAFTASDDSTNSTIPTVMPHLIVDTWGHLLEDGQPHIITSIDNITSTNNISNATEGLSLRDRHHPTWVVSYMGGTEDYHQLRLSVAADSSRLEGVSIIHQDLVNMPEEAKTEEYYQDLDNIRQYARELVESSLVEEAGAKTYAMPTSTNASDGFRFCYVGECEFGNLVVDALRWVEDADVAFLPSFLFNGPGWSDGEIRYLELHENLPYASQRCGGMMTGLSLMRLLHHSITVTSFGGYDGVQAGGKLLQVSGLNVRYNNQLGDDERILSVDVWDKELGQFEPVAKTRMYSFTTNTHICFTYSFFPEFVGDHLIEEGEIPAFRQSEKDIKDDVKHYLLTQFANTTYQPLLEGRLINDLDDTNPPLQRWNEREDCQAGFEFWNTTLLSCDSCPSYNRLQFSKNATVLIGQSSSQELLFDRVILTNGEPFVVRVIPETLSLPQNIELWIEPGMSQGIPPTTTTTSPSRDSNETAYDLDPGKSLTISILFDPSERIIGTDTSSLLLEIHDSYRFFGCAGYKMKYGIIAQLSLSEDRNHLDGVAIFGYASAAIITLVSLFFATWVRYHRNVRVVSTMQPFFLMMICFGVLLLGLSLIPLSIDDGVASTKGCEIACMAKHWLLVIGFTVTVSALNAKLRRINKVFHQPSFRRIRVREKDVIVPNIILLAVQCALMFTWTLTDMLTWKRREVEGQPWNTYGTCAFGDKIVGKVIVIVIAVVCSFLFIQTCWQAYKARDISSEFSEAKYLGMAIFSWVQLCVVGAPVMFLVDDDNIVAKYSLDVGLQLAFCMSMLLVIFIPIMAVKYNLYTGDTTTSITRAIRGRRRRSRRRRRTDAVWEQESSRSRSTTSANNNQSAVMLTEDTANSCNNLSLPCSESENNKEEEPPQERLNGESPSNNNNEG